MPPQRHPRPRRARTPPSANPSLQAGLPAPVPPDELLPPLNVLASTPGSGREVSTEPATPASPTLHTRALQRERSVDIPPSVLHYYM
jgi:hypothetical protein